MPRGIRGLLHERVDMAGETGWQLLTAAAVIGRSFDYDLLRAVSGRSDAEMVATLETLVRQGLVREQPPGNGARLIYDFSHEKIRELVYTEASLARRRLLHHRAADTLTRQAQDPRVEGELSGQITRHLQLAGREADAARYEKLAGEHARTLYANEQALTHFRSALALGHPDAAEIHEAIGDLQMLSGAYRAALASMKPPPRFAARGAWPGSNRSWGTCTTGAAIGSWPKPISRRP